MYCLPEGNVFLHLPDDDSYEHSSRPPVCSRNSNIVRRRSRLVNILCTKAGYMQVAEALIFCTTAVAFVALHLLLSKYNEWTS